MHDHHPDPDALLARVQAEEHQQQRGRLKVFFGAAAGVGKTFAMLDAAHQCRADGVDVVVGWVDTHGRAETDALLAGLEVVPRLPVPYRGTTLDEFDLDAALARKPELILLDELAHTNVPGSRHPKRWQDIEELLAAGINVYTTVNVQHLESLNDVITQITGVHVRETIPDRILEDAQEVEMIDLPPDELLKRLREGKVAVPLQAVRTFFRKGNLIALRELALRRTADQVDAQMQSYMRDHAIQTTWPTVERLMVCIGPSPFSTKLVRAARRLATSLRAAWLAVYIETPAHVRLSDEDRDQVVHTLQLAEQLGAEAVTLVGDQTSRDLLSYARQRNVSKIIIGKPARPFWRDLLVGSVVDQVIRGSGDIDVYVISGERVRERPVYHPRIAHAGNWRAYGISVSVVVLCTLLSRLMFPYFEPSNLIMVYLLGVIVVASHFGRGPAVLASILSVAAFDFFFVPPHLTFAVADAQYLITFAVMLLAALVISTLTARLRQQAEAARQRERRTAALYSLSQELASTRGLENLLSAAVRHIADVFENPVVIFLPDAQGHLRPWNGLDPLQLPQVEPAIIFDPNDREQEVAAWVYAHHAMAGRGTETLVGADGLYLPLTATGRTIGVLGVQPAGQRQIFTPDQFHLLETFASQTALAIERARLADAAQQAQVQAETERLRSSLLNSVSHDLRTPLASITGAASTLLQEDAGLTLTTQQELTQAIYDEATRLNRLVNNLLEMTRLESGAVHVNKEWLPLEEVIGAALTRLDERLRDRPLQVDLPPDLPLVPMDGVLIEQVLVNLVENALKYTPAASPLDLDAQVAEGLVTVSLTDRGPGIPPGDEQRIFEKFVRAHPTISSGVGLGLTICRAIVEAHGGRIWVEQRPGGGAMFRFTLPAAGAPPVLPPELEALAEL